MVRGYQRESLPDWLHAFGDQRAQIVASINQDFNMIEGKFKKKNRKGRGGNAMKRTASGIWVHDDDLPYFESTLVLMRLACVKEAHTRFSNLHDDIRTTARQKLYKTFGST